MNRLSNIVGIAAGGGYYGDHALALGKDGSVFAWGYNGSGQTNVPSCLSNVVAIAAGGETSMALTLNGSVAVWGANNAQAPEHFWGNSIAIAVGGDNCLAITRKPRIRSFSVSENQALIRFFAAEGQRYLVECSPELSAGSWASLPSGEIEGAGRDAVVVDTNAPAGRPKQFYRLKFPSEKTL